MTPVKDEWLTAVEAAAYLKLNIDTVHRLAAKGELKRYGKPRMYRFRRSELDRYLEQDN